MLGLSLALATVLAQVISEEPVDQTRPAPGAWRSSRQVVHVAFGAAAWPGLRRIGRIDAAPGWQPFHSQGFVLQGAYRYNVLHRGGAELLLGASGGLSVTRAGSPEGTPVSHDGTASSDLWLLSTGLSATADARLQAAAGPLRPFVSGGAGVYDLTLAIEQTGGLVSTTDTEVLHRTRPMAWLGAGGDYRFGPPELCWGIVAEVRVQLVNMGSARDVASGGGSMKGPIYTFTVGALLGVGH
jgi:hypothetical protein